MVKKQATKKLTKKKSIVTKTVKGATGSGMYPKKDSLSLSWTTIKDTEKKHAKFAGQEHKRKDSRQVKIDRLEHENSCLRSRNQELYSISDWFSNVIERLREVYKKEIDGLTKRVRILGILLFLSVVSHIMLAFYTM